MTQCPNCKILLEYGKTVCSNCGYRTNPSMNQQKLKPPTPASQPVQIKEFACPYCNNIFSTQSIGVPTEIQCPFCRERVVII